MKCIIIIGASPPPENGIACHLNRLYSILITNKFNVKWIDPYNYKIISNNKVIYKNKLLIYITILWKLLVSRDIIHLHASRLGKFMLFWPISYLNFKRKKLRIISIHGAFEKSYSKYGKIKKLMSITLLKYFNKIIVTNDSINNLISSLIKDIEVITLPAFLPFLGQLSQLTSLNKRDFKNTNVLCCGSAEKIYNFAFILKIAKKLQNSDDIHFYICVYHRKSEEVTKLLDEASYCDNITILYDLDEPKFLWLMNKCQIFLRPTLEDGDSIAVREALYNGLYTICSNCVFRPQGTISLDLNDENKWISEIQTYKYQKSIIQTDNKQRYLELYNEL